MNSFFICPLHFGSKRIFISIKSSLCIQPSLPPALRLSFVLLSTLTSTTSLSCRPLVFLLPRPRATSNSGVCRITQRKPHTHTHLPGVSPCPLGRGWFCVLCVFAEECDSSDRLINLGFIHHPAHSVLCLLFPHSHFPSSNVSALKQGLHYWWSCRPPPQPSVCLGRRVDAGQEGQFEGFTEWVSPCWTGC